MDTVLSIVIVEYHSIGEIQRCVASLKTHVKVPYEVVVSSNSCYSAQQQEAITGASSPAGGGWGEAEAAVRWIFNERNGGFAYAMNEGLKVARGRYLAIMNSDCTLESDIDGMIRFMEDHPAIGAIAPQMRDAEGNIQDTARPYVSVPRYVWRQTKRIVRHKISVLDTQMDYSLTQTAHADYRLGHWRIHHGLTESLRADGRARQPLLHVCRGSRLVHAHPPTRAGGRLLPPGAHHL